MVKDIIRRNTLAATEIQIFNGVKKWIENQVENGDASSWISNCGEILSSLMSEIRLCDIDNEDLLFVVKPSGLVPDNMYIKALEQKLMSVPVTKRYFKA